jgi:hypothetical protein
MVMVARQNVETKTESDDAEVKNLPLTFDHITMINTNQGDVQGTRTGGEGYIQLTSSLR